MGKNKKNIFQKLGTGRRLRDDTFFELGDRVCRPIQRECIIDDDDDDNLDEGDTAGDGMDQDGDHVRKDARGKSFAKNIPCCVPTCKQIFKTLVQFEMHYNSCHRFICSQCKKALPTSHLLDLHLSETHDSFFKAMAERNPMYRCYVEACSMKFQMPDERRMHCIEVHNFPHDFRFDNSFKKTKPNDDKMRGGKVRNDRGGKFRNDKYKSKKPSADVEMKDNNEDTLKEKKSNYEVEEHRKTNNDGEIKNKESDGEKMDTVDTVSSVTVDPSVASNKLASGSNKKDFTSGESTQTSATASVQDPKKHFNNPLKGSGSLTFGHFTNSRGKMFIPRQLHQQNRGGGNKFNRNRFNKPPLQNRMNPNPEKNIKYEENKINETLQQNDETGEKKSESNSETIPNLSVNELMDTLPPPT